MLDSVLWVSLLAAASAVDLETALRKPLSPASLALLLGHAGRPQAWDRWRDGLNDPKVENRAAAARMVFLAGASTLAPDVEDALGREQDVTAAEEEAQALLALQGAAGVDPVLAAYRRLPSMTAAALLARALGPGALGLLPERLSVFGDAPTSWVDFFRLTTRDGSEGMAAAWEKALRAGSAPWAGLLEMSRDAKLEPEASVLREASTSSDLAVRAVTCLHLAIVASAGGRVDREVQAAALAPPDKSGSEADVVQATVACELLGRALGRKAQHDLSTVAGPREGPDRLSFELVRNGLERLLTKGERKAFFVGPTDDGVKVWRKPPVRAQGVKR